MNKIFEIVLPFRVRSKKNSQRILRRKNGSPFIASASKTKTFERAVSMACREKYGDLKPSSGAITFYTVAVFKIPSSGKNKEKMPGEWCDLMPDSSNIDNLLHDALQGVAYGDDRQIVESITRKIWGYNDEINIKIYDEGW